MTTQVEEDPIRITATEDSASESDRKPGSRAWIWPVVGGSLVAAGIIAGLLGRAWWLTHAQIDSDQAVVGLMARQILHGHLSAFYWGQTYGGVEPYLVAAVFGIAGQSAFSLTVVPAILMAATALLTWRVALRLVNDRWMAALAGVVVWAVPMLGTTNTTEYGFRNLTLAVGVGILLVCLRVLDGHTTIVDLAALGLLVGVGWWASPEIAFYLVPAAPLFLAAVIGTWRTRGRRFWLPRIGITAIGIGIGALPWLWSNVPDGFPSLDASKVTVAGSGGYLSHLHVFFMDVLPLQLGVHRTIDGAPPLPGALGLIAEVVILGVLISSVVVCLFQGGRGRAIAVGVLAFPFLYAVDPLGGFWYDGRYSVYFPPLAVLAIVMGCERLARLIAPRVGSHAHSRSTGPERARGGGRAAVAVLMVIAVSSSATGFAWIVSNKSEAVLQRDPNAGATRVVGLLEQHGIRVGYANYWVAYKLDYLSGGALEFSPTPWDKVRSTTIADQVATSARPAWLFVTSAGTTAANAQFGTNNLQPGFAHESAFEGSLLGRGIPFSVAHVGYFDAIVPQRTLTPRQAVFG